MKMAKTKLLNIREHLKHVQEAIDMFQKYGDCPVVRDSFATASLINRAILRKHEEARIKGDRKDIR
jgi:hypothetical protein